MAEALSDAGVPVVFLHGWGGSARGTWIASGIPDQLSARGRYCIVADLPGHGRPSGLVEMSHDPDHYDNIVDMVAADLPPGIVDLVGYSLGAKIALTIAARPQSQVRRLVATAVGDNIFRAEPSGLAMSALLETGILADTPQRLRRMAVYALQSGGDPRALAACLRRRWHPPTEAMLRSIRIPVLLALADEDELVTSSEQLEQCLPQARTLRLSGQDHLSAPFAAELKPLIVTFLS